MKPGAEVYDLGAAEQRGPRGEHRVLHDIIGAVSSYDPLGVGSELALVTLVDRAERLLIAGAGERRKPFVSLRPPDEP